MDQVEAERRFCVACVAGYANKLVAALAMDHTVRTATKFVSPKLTVKLTRHQPARKNARNQTLLLTYGQPNYAEREFIAQCKKVGEELPVRKIQLKFYPKKKGRRK